MKMKKEQKMPGDEGYFDPAEMSQQYEEGLAAGRRSPHDIACPYDGRTRAGKAWWSGFVVGDRERCSRSVLPTTNQIIEIDAAGQVHVPKDPRDATITELREEVERLTRTLDQIGEECEIRIASREAAQARALLVRLKI